MVKQRCTADKFILIHRFGITKTFELSRFDNFTLSSITTNDSDNLPVSTVRVIT